MLQIAIPLYDEVAALDVVGPYEVLSRLPGSELRFVGHRAGPVRTEIGGLALQADAAFEEVPEPEVVVVPGGSGNRGLLDDDRLLGWIRGAHAQSQWTTSVCTGSLLLGAAGILDGLAATSHWLELDALAGYGASPTRQRVVTEGKIITAAGVSAGIDMALELSEKIAGREVAEAIQLSLEYDPQPPFDAGSVSSARPETVELVRAVARERAAGRRTGSEDAARRR